MIYIIIYYNLINKNKLLLEESINQQKIKDFAFYIYINKQIKLIYIILILICLLSQKIFYQNRNYHLQLILPLYQFHFFQFLLKII